METETISEQYPDLLEALLPTPPMPARTVYDIGDFIKACAEMEPRKRDASRRKPPIMRDLHETLRSANKYSYRRDRRKANNTPRVRVKKSATFEEKWLAFYEAGVVVEEVNGHEEA